MRRHTINIFKKNNELLDRRLSQLNKATLVLIALMLSNSVLFSNEKTGIGLLFVDLILMLTLHFYLIKNCSSKVARNFYIWSNILTASFLMWSTASPHYALVMPIYILIASLMVNKKSFLIISAYCAFAIGVAGFLRVNHLNAEPLNPLFGLWQMNDLLIIFSSAIYTALQASSDMKYALKSLSQEIQKVTESHSEIENLIQFDALTGLINKCSCEKQYAQLYQTTNFENDKIAVFFLDLDNFKAINDFYDHSVGDKLLIAISKRLKSQIHYPEEVACRLSGDEFVIIIQRPREFNIQLFSHRLLNEISRPIEIDSNLIDITASVGVAIADRKDHEFNEIRKKADLAMYTTKQKGKNNYHIYNKEMLQQSENRLLIVNGIKTALKDDGLEVYLQPKVDIRTGRITSAEALVRWTDKNTNNVGPAEFIPLIESTELICDLGEWVIHHACKLCKEWHNNGFTDMSIAVNISSSQFIRGGLTKIIERELKSSQLPAKFLELELTEHAVFHDDDGVLRQLKSLKELGITLSIDDFGTGYSNLSYLSKFNVDILKIDRSFITDISSSTEQSAIVEAIINMARTLGLKVVAEGVENNKQWSTLKKLGCNYGQGFLWSRALTSEHFMDNLKRDHTLRALNH